MNKFHAHYHVRPINIFFGYKRGFMLRAKMLVYARAFVLMLLIAGSYVITKGGASVLITAAYV
jgi:hypothetical protein